MINAGTYKAHATKAELGETKAGAPQIAVTFRIIDDDQPEAVGAELVWYGYFTEKAKARTLESLVHAGWDGDDIEELAGLGTTEVNIVVELDTYNGRTRPKVQWVNAIGGSALQKTMDESSKKTFAKSLKADLADLRKRMKLDAPAPRAPGRRATPFD